MNGDPLQDIQGKIVVCWMPTCLFTANLKSIHLVELCFEDNAAAAGQLIDSRWFAYGEVRRC
jgi:hypothetical protein